jgi:invasion protein IalB
MFGLCTLRDFACGSAIVTLAATAAFAQTAPKPAAPAPAQQAPAAQPAAPAAQGQAAPGGPSTAGAPQPEWMKLCSTDPANKKEVCLTARDVRTDTGQTVASVALREIKGDPKKFFLIALPPGLLIQPGIRIVVDQKTPQPGKFSICFPNACYAEVEAKDDFVGTMKSGNQVAVQALNREAKPVVFAVSLAGFSKAYDGAPLDPKIAEQSQRRLNEELQRKAEEARKRYMDQGAAGTPATPTAAVPAAPVPAPN